MIMFLFVVVVLLIYIFGGSCWYNFWIKSNYGNLKIKKYNEIWISKLWFARVMQYSTLIWPLAILITAPLHWNEKFFKSLYLYVPKSVLEQSNLTGYSLRCQLSN